jgi:hypothetical protein
LPPGPEIETRLGPSLREKLRLMKKRGRMGGTEYRFFKLGTIVAIINYIKQLIPAYMKHRLTLVFITVSIILIASSCKKNNASQPPPKVPPAVLKYTKNITGTYSLTGLQEIQCPSPYRATYGMFVRMKIEARDDSTIYVTTDSIAITPLDSASWTSSKYNAYGRTLHYSSSNDSTMTFSSSDASYTSSHITSSAWNSLVFHYLKNSVAEHQGGSNVPCGWFADLTP